MCALLATSALGCAESTELTVTATSEDASIARLLFSAYNRAGVVTDVSGQAVQGRLLEGVTLPALFRVSLAARAERIRLSVRGDNDSGIALYGVAELDVRVGRTNRVELALTADATDYDHDDVPDVIDNCYDVPNPDQRNDDAMGPGDLCLEGNPPSVAPKIARYDFGSFVVGADSGVAAIAFTNVGGQRSSLLTATLGGLDISQFEKVGDECSGKELLPGVTCNVLVRFIPSIAGALKARVDLGGDDVDTRVELEGTAVPPGTIAIEPTLVDFGMRVFGATADVAVVVRNIGTTATSALDPLTISGSDASRFEIVTDSCMGIVLQPGATCPALVRYSAGAPAGAQSAALVAAAIEGGVSVGSLSGTALTPATLVATPAALTFPSLCATCLGCTIRSTFITNTGGQPSTPISISIGNAFIFTGCEGVSLMPMQTCRIDARFRPPAQASYAQQMSVTAAQGGVTTVTLNGTGTQACTCQTCGTPMPIDPQEL